MSKPSDVRIRSVRTWTELFDYRAPMKFGGRVVREVVMRHVEIAVETRTGRRAVGSGSMPVGNIWAWPSQQLDASTTLQQMLDFGQSCCQLSEKSTFFAHPLEIAHDLWPEFHDAAPIDVDGTGEGMPALAQRVAVSPWEAALFDAQGKALGANSYNLLSEEFLNRDLSAYLSPAFIGEYLDRYTLRTPQPRMPLYHLVGALDPLTDADITQPIADGLPETLAQWIVADGLTHLKIKLNGDDLRWDVLRVADIETLVTQLQARGDQAIEISSYSLDFNERCPNVDYVLDFLGGLREAAPGALNRVQYIEQPTHRDLRANPENRMHRAAAIKPVVIDESLIDFESLLLCRELGYSGVALKACKGQSESLLMGAAAQKFGLFLSVQDLTCPGGSFLHSASLAARIPTVAAIEGNGRQYCPAGNLGWTDRYPGAFQVRAGQIDTSDLTSPGLY